MIDEAWVKNHTDRCTNIVSLDADDVLEVISEVQKLRAALNEARILYCVAVVDPLTYREGWAEGDLKLLRAAAAEKWGQDAAALLFPSEKEQTP